MTNDPRKRGLRLPIVLVHAVVFLLMGAIGAVAVAWAVAAWSMQDEWVDETEVSTPAAWPGYLEALDWPEPYASSVHDLLGATWGVTVLDVRGDSEVCTECGAL